MDEPKDSAVRHMAARAPKHARRTSERQQSSVDDYLRAFDVRTGAELWKGRLPGGGQATPMTYEIGGRQFVVIAAGGHGGADTTRNDTLVAFALPIE